EEVLVAVAARAVPDEHPAQRYQPGPRPVPVAGAAGGLHPPRAAAVPADRQPAEAAPPFDGLAGPGQGAALDPRPAPAGVARGRLVQVGVGVQLADQRQAGAVAVAEAGDRVGAVARVADEQEGATGEAQQQQSQQPAHQLRRGAVGPPPLAVVLGAAVQVHQDRQGPGAGGERQADQDGQDDPLVAVPPSRVGLARTDGVAVPGLAVDPAAGVAVDGVVADQGDAAVGDDVPQEEAAQQASQADA